MIFCDLDLVLVRQVGRVRFDLMGWMPDGRILWDFIKPRRPTILSQLRPDIYAVSKPEKITWCVRELGPDVPVIVARFEDGKYPHCKPGDIIIDDDAELHREKWEAAGGIFIHHRSAAESIAALKALNGG